MRNFLTRAALITAAVIGFVGTGASTAMAQNPCLEASMALDSGRYADAIRIVDLAVQTTSDVDLLICSGDIYMRAEEFVKARDVYRRAFDKRDDDQQVNRKYGLALAATGDITQAVERIQAALKSEESVENYIALAQAYLAAGGDSLTRGELTLQKANLNYPGNARVLVAQGDIYFNRNIYTLAQQKYEEALQADPTMIEPRIRLARTYRSIGRQKDSLSEAQPYYQKALFEYNNVTGRAPREAMPWREQGELLIFAEEWEPALKSLMEYHRLRPDDPRGDVLMARAAYRGNYYEQAIKPLERIILRSDSVSEAFKLQARVMLGKSYYAMKRYPESSAIYAQIPDSLIGIEGVKLYASAIMLSGGDTLRALDLYKRLSEANPSDCDLSLQLGNMLYQTKRYSDVIEVFNQRMANCPTEPSGIPYFFIGLSHYAKKNFDQAITALQLAMADTGAPEQTYYWLMQAYGSKKQYGKAGDVASQMIARGIDKTQPRWVATAYWFSGIEQFQAKDFKESIPYFERAMRADPTYSEPVLYLAFAYQSMNKKEDACRYYAMVLKLGGENVKIARDNMKAIGCN